MFNLLRYFSTISFILIVLAAGVFGPLYRQLAEKQISHMAERRNVETAEQLERLLSPPLRQLLLAAPGGDDGAAQRQSARLTAFGQQLSALMANTTVVEARFYNRLGVVVFASAPTPTGERLNSAGFRAALAGGVSSELKRQTLPATDGRPVERQVLVSLFPLPGRDGEVEGVFELYQDVTPLMVELERSQRWVAVSVFTVFALLFFLQYLLVRRAQRILNEQERRLKAARDTLEQEIEARTGELRETNLKLQDEIAERREAESKLNYLAYHDPLTGLANRRSFVESLDVYLRGMGDGGRQLAVLFIDLDQFKQVNDAFGHSVGDELLITVAARLSEVLRAADMLSRIGGDEFICLIGHVRSEDEAILVAGQIVDAFNQPFRFDGYDFSLTASVGICLAPRDGSGVVELMRNADTAMYQAKALGRGQFSCYRPEMTRRAQERSHVENLLRRALENDELAICLQAQVDAGSGRLTGAEALLRWHSPELGLVLPNRFIPLAEESGIIIAIGAWVLRQTCRLAQDWAADGFTLPMVSVNVSARQLEDPEFDDMLRGILAETGMNPARLKLELTESVLMGVGEASAHLDHLRQIGVSLALDDFGIGYSSLSYLKQLPVQQLKIDRSFVTGIGRNKGDEAIIRSVIELAGHLGFGIVAEGVETPEQAAFLTALGCQQLQGNLHGAAATPAEFRRQWDKRPDVRPDKRPDKRP
ncbi:MAG: EAL domain-containing protein [Azonexus sp.]|jgi:diguanylate cyclase (GGDEF)-like protein|nr:EAL domain-containing protein [Azonexus sp.]